MVKDEKGRLRFRKRTSAEQLKRRVRGVLKETRGKIHLGRNNLLRKKKLRPENKEKFGQLLEKKTSGLS